MSNQPWTRFALVLTLVAAVLVLPACGDAAPHPSDAMNDSDSSPGSNHRAAAGSTGSNDINDPALAAWDRLLRQHVRDGDVDYAALKADRSDLDTFLAHLARTDPASLPRGERLAFWVNAYNAYVIDAVLERYPGIESVKAVDGFFDGETHTVGGRQLTLDQIEAGSRELDPDLAHFGVVCASFSCPDLRSDAYVGSRVTEQLEEQARRFLADPTKGLRYDAGENDLYLSSIFKWYAGDFTGGSTVVAFFARGGILEWVVEHVGDRQLARTLEEREPSIKYMDYDWTLNDL